MSWHGGAFGQRARCVVAPNPGLMTLDGTNTWILREPGATRSVVIDPGPADAGHLGAVADIAGEVAVVLLTHRHPDHSDGARDFADLVGCEVRAVDPALRLGSKGLTDGHVVKVDGLEIRVVSTPGHSSDSVSLVLSADRAVLTGDTVLGRGTTVVAHPDGELAPYLASLRRLRRLVGEYDLRRILPGHGPVLEDAGAVLEAYLTHREQRLDQVRAALAQGATEAADVVRRVYADVDPALWPAAELSVRAQLDYLHTER